MSKIVVVLFLFSVFFISFLPVKDTDFGWHYRCGKEFFQNKDICLKNNFSYFLPRYQSANPHLLYDLLIAFLFDRFGFNGLSVFYSSLLSLSALIFINLTAPSLFLKIVVFYLMFFLSYSVFGLGLRSQIISYLFFLLILFILEKTKTKSRYLFFLPLLFFIWVNSHIGFFIGLIAFLFFIVKDNIRLLYDRTIHVTSNFATIVIFIAAFLATLINPFGPNVYQEIVNHATSSMNQMIAEWVGPPIWQKILILIFIFGAVILMLKQKSFSLFYFLWIAFFGYFAFLARRNLLFFYTSFFLLLIYHLDNGRDKDGAINNLLLPILISIGLFFAIVNIPTTLNFHRFRDVYCHQGLSRYPCRAIKSYPQLSGNVFNTYEWGGFLIWQKPNIKVFVDGRMPAWKDKMGKSPYQVFLEIIQTQPGWNEKLRKWRTDYLLISKGTFLDLLLEKEAAKYNWRKVYGDETAVIYKNKL